jgi:predicted MFS family arabinose efflux permease
VFAVAAAQSVVSAFSSPAESALLPSLVGPDELIAANSLNTLNNRIARLAGVPLGGVLLTSSGLEAVVVVDMLSFAAAAMLIAPIAPPHVARVPLQASSAWESFWREWLEGLRLVGSDRTIALLFLVLGLMTFGGTMLDPLTVAWVRDVLGEGPQVFALILTVHAASGIVGSLLVGRFGGRFTPRDLIGWGSVVAGGALALRYNVPTVALALAMSALAGITSVASSIGVETLAMQSVQDELRGRVFGSLNATLGLLSVAGATVAGLVAEIIGIVPMLNIATALIALAGVLVLRAYAR